MSTAGFPEIDSRQYVFSYLIRSPEDVPADFPIPEPKRLLIGLFLPRDDPDWFGRRAYPPRILFLNSSTLLILTHPRYDEPPVRLALEDIEFYEIGHLLLIGWIQMVTAQMKLRLPYNTRSDRPVGEFLDAFAQQYLPSAIDSGSGILGLPLDIKFRNCLAAAVVKGERVLAKWFSPAQEGFRRWGPFRIRAEAGGDLVALTDRRILWITDRCNGRYERYGSILSTTPLRRVAGALGLRDNRQSSLVIRLRSGASWSIPLSSERFAEAESFAREVEAAVNRGILPGHRSEEAQT